MLLNMVLSLVKRKSRVVAKGKFAGSKNPAYKGGRILDKNGYVRMRGSVAARQYEHQYIMEQHLGRKLEEGEEVHHINGNKSDNRLENLYLVDKKNHSRVHFNLFLEVQRLEWENLWLRKELENYKQNPQVKNK